MTNQELLLHCAPTLANVKLGNLFTVHNQNPETLAQAIAKKQQIFREKGVEIRALTTTNNRTLIYVFRNKQLQERLQSPQIQAFLSTYGYHDFTVEGALQTLETALTKSDFPHEIGVFLGYPLEDIQGFILNEGKNSYITGCWKVYHNPEHAQLIFAKYKKCVKIYLEKYAQGFDITRLTVAQA